MRGKNIIYVYLSAITLGLVLLHLFIFTQSVALKYDVANITLKLRAAKSTNRLLANRLSAAESLVEVEKKAQKLGMHYPERVNYIVLTSEAK